MLHTPEDYGQLVAERHAMITHDAVTPGPARPPAAVRHYDGIGKGEDMDTTSALARFEAALTDQLVLAGGDPAVEAAARSLHAALGPATRQLAMDLAAQAAEEVDAQLPDHEVRVLLEGGEPALAVRPNEQATPPQDEERYEARITLRLPPSVKGLVEDAARATGESVNSWVVDALAGAASRRRSGRPGRRVRGTVQT